MIMACNSGGVFQSLASLKRYLSNSEFLVNRLLTFPFTTFTVNQYLLLQMSANNNLGSEL